MSLRAPSSCVALMGTLALLLGGCASTPVPPDPATPAPQEAPAVVAPVPAATAPALPAPPAPGDLELLARPDPEPRADPVPPGGPNKAYDVGGQGYEPLRGDPQVHERGMASWYGRPFHGRKTASGEVFDMYGLSAAHKTLPIPSYARVRNPANGREVVVRINDRGPFSPGRIVDLSYAAAVKLGVRGVAPVELSRITHEEIRSGTWRREPPTLAAADVPPVANTPAPARPQPAFTAAARGFWLQLGAFARGDNVAALRRRVEEQAQWLAPLLTVFQDAGLHRLQAGPYPSRQDAQGAAERLRHVLQLVPLVTERN